MCVCVCERARAHTRIRGLPAAALSCTGPGYQPSQNAGGYSGPTPDLSLSICEVPGPAGNLRASLNGPESVRSLRPPGRTLRLSEGPCLPSPQSSWCPMTLILGHCQTCPT